MDKGPEQTFFKTRRLYVKKCPTPLIIKKTQTQTRTQETSRLPGRLSQHTEGSASRCRCGARGARRAAGGNASQHTRPLGRTARRCCGDHNQGSAAVRRAPGETAPAGGPPDAAAPHVRCGALHGGPGAEAG